MTRALGGLGPYRAWQRATAHAPPFSSLDSDLEAFAVIPHTVASRIGFSTKRDDQLCESTVPLVLDDEAFGYLKRVIVTPAVYPRLVEFLHFDIRSTGVNHIALASAGPSQCFVLIKQIPLVRTRLESTTFDARGRPSKEPFQVRPRQHAVARSRRGSSFEQPAASRRVRTRTPCPPPSSQSFSRLRSILPTSLAYILPSTAGRSPWRPDAVMSTTGANDTRSSGFSRAAGRTDTTNVRCSSSSPDPTSAEPFPGGAVVKRKDNSSRGPRRRLRLPNVAVNRRVPVQNFNPIPFRSSRETRFRRGYPDS
ncbi:hypothetical protein Syun_031930 [Stephania yunnanensis]|uniref:Uncharacterized protein n=1 Tax=Stephania yunnanensis TaxID=152371 RepID=A0AAP0HFF3_9MAGN